VRVQGWDWMIANQLRPGQFGHHQKGLMGEYSREQWMLMDKVMCESAWGMDNDVCLSSTCICVCVCVCACVCVY
jgi:hypothetical protein